jgi:xanthine dehydrogenase YagT iron-sulfur-binding subunit
VKKNKRKEGHGRCDRGVSRRSFLAAVGAGTAALASPGRFASGQPEGREEVLEGAETSRVALLVNGRTHWVLVEPRTTLLYVLREKLGLTGTKEGCGRGECGACTVLMEDTPRYACMTLAVEAEGVSITTVEGLMEGEDLGPVQRAFVEHDAFQCGYCTPGQVMSVEGLMRANPDPSLEDIRTAVSGNLCRCGAYANIFKAARRARELRPHT